ncbi:hypothetical protein FIBSPDRAFT_1051979 [Athelia psychrophila]|uniref:Uncharacterized protein n=1 Tax=Athelia psychrophila TaxID=1759441 RepID=A0A165Y3W7_9AGAM|nr:hypothetical protein FIBSPDRAFT_1051979 [Fibularhizoctonia sp. CBS 109695]
MFGESDTGESPRVGSPWDALISTPSPPSPQYIPKLVPEAEEGNVEYKLQLLSPSPARFARLVTQLKWRLLEGGGQAYYELGVADSGALIGLARADLEKTLGTLDSMAGEIGASVVVVKEVEVPRGMHIRGGDRAGLFAGSKAKADRENGNGNGNGKFKRLRWDASSSEDTPPTETETDDEALFSMDDLSLDLEIATVYKPRPVCAKATHHGGPVPAQKKKKNWPKPTSPSPTTVPSALSSPPPPTKTNGTPTTNTCQTMTKSRNRRRRRDEKRRFLDGVEAAESTDGADEQERELILVEGLECLHVEVTVAPDVAASAHAPLPVPGSSIRNNVVDGTNCAPNENGDEEEEEEEEEEPRLIVEALVVRKLSLEEVPRLRGVLVDLMF